MIEFDASAERLRCDSSTFESLVEGLAVAGPDMGGAIPVRLGHDLAEQGVLTPEGIVPAVAASLEAVIAPVAQVRLWSVGVSSASMHQAWAAGGRTALLLHVTDDEYDLLGVGTSLLPVTLARLTRIGPRRTPSVDVVEPDGDVLQGIWAPDVDVRSAAMTRLRAAAPDNLARAIDDERVWWWSVECAWMGRDGEVAGRGLQVLDGAAGAWVRVGERLEPTTARELWRGLLRLLPHDDELGAGGVASTSR